MQRVTWIVNKRKLIHLSLCCLEVRLTLLSEKYRPHLAVYYAYYSLPLIEPKCFHFIVQLLSNVRPWTSVWTYHVTSVSDRLVLEGKFVLDDDILVTHSKSNPVLCTLDYFELKSSNILIWRNTRLQKSNLVRLSLLRHGPSIACDENIWRFEFRWKIKNVHFENVLQICPCSVNIYQIFL
jgi:hypothetical protein